MFRLLASGITLVGLMALTAVFGQSVGSEPALTRSNSVLPPPPHFGTPVLLEHRPRPLHPLGLLRLVAPPGRGRRR